MTDRKVLELKEQFPEADESSLLEILISCDGSISTAERVLMESFPEGPRRKRAKVEKQRNIRTMFGASSGKQASTNTKGANKPVYLYTKEDLENTIPYATIHYDFLPKEVSNALLKTVMHDEENFLATEFYLFGNKCVSNHESKVYSSKPVEGIFYNGVETKAKSAFTDNHGIAQVLIEDVVNMEINARPRLPYEYDGPWKGDIALCNRFHNKSNDLAWHSDRLTYIGPHCTIASLSLGATREFRIRQQYSTKDTLNFNTIYSIPLPHNTLLVMHAGFQEEFKHCVSSTTELTPHSISGPMRVNLTYRHYLAHYKDHSPECELCGNAMELRRSYKNPRTRGRYLWLCSAGYKGKECPGMYWWKFGGEHWTKDVREASMWIAPHDHEALAEFRQKIRQRIEDEAGVSN